MATIGYRRLSGSIGLSLKEHGTRGLWWEKRRALVNYLEEDRRHSVHFIGRMTKQTMQDGDVPIFNHDPDGKHRYDVLFVEFGGTNAQFFGKALAETYRLVERHKGPIFYLCDDPDLWFPWKAMPGEDWSRWTVLVNAAAERAGPRVYPVPGGARVLDLPVASLLTPDKPVEKYARDNLVYVGRPDGRSDAFRRLIAANAPFRVYGRSEEWEEYGVRVEEAPPQPQRGAFYAGQIGCLAVADKKHKKMLWRTGRAYHAVAAGCPVLAEANHTLLASNFGAYDDPARVREWVERWRDPARRADDVRQQQGAVARERPILEDTIRECSL